METASPTTAENAPAHYSHPDAQRTFGKAKFLVAAYGALSAAVLITVVVLAVTGRTVTSFMWGRSAGVLASAAVTYWLTVLASRGARWAYLRMRLISVIVPIAIIAIDMIPGALPPWFVVMQVACALALGASAFLVNGAGLRAAFAKSG
ncbi:hypothetical protein FCH28_08020 [Streptomyces piniterrae]|uniref:Uncharacterized protein n=1 Tax=Streptomyces piniterrae TaxID=2571125 RepID=A0A4U0NRX4_9ACTN|nr:hypothetical protein [Streptomyces piniterrae]TJZ57361.1 hypothetical protein FCH28_08020 [Streptomyces piniterrae]